MDVGSTAPDRPSGSRRKPPDIDRKHACADCRPQSVRLWHAARHGTELLWAGSAVKAAQTLIRPPTASHLSSGNPLAYGNHGYSNGYASPASPSAAHSYPNTPGWSGGYDARSDPFAMQETASADHGAGGEVAHHAQRPPRQGKRSWYAPRQAMTR